MNIIGNVVGLSSAVVAAAVGGIVTDRAVLDQGTHVPLGVAVAVVMTAVGVSIPLARKFQRIFDELQIVKQSVNKLESTIINLPCRRPSCPDDEKTKRELTGIHLDDDDSAV